MPPRARSRPPASRRARRRATRPHAAQPAIAYCRSVVRGFSHGDPRAAPALDATGLVNLGSAVERIRERGVLVVLAGLQPQPLRALARAGWRNRSGEILLRRAFERGVETIRRELAGNGTAAPDTAL